MSNSDPKDGDFASLVEEKALLALAALPEAHPNPALSHAGEAEPVVDAEPHQTIEDVLMDGEEPTEEFLESMRARAELPPLTEEELAAQALASGGGDGDPGTPE